MMLQVALALPSTRIAASTEAEGEEDAIKGCMAEPSRPGSGSRATGLGGTSPGNWRAAATRQSV